METTAPVAVATNNKAAEAIKQMEAKLSQKEEGGIVRSRANSIASTTQSGTSSSSETPSPDPSPEQSAVAPVAPLAQASQAHQEKPATNTATATSINKDATPAITTAVPPAAGSTAAKPGDAPAVAAAASSSSSAAVPATEGAAKDAKDVAPAAPQKLIEDLVLLPQEVPNEADITECLHQRFQKDLIYTSIGPVLVACNPFKLIPNMYSDENLRSYIGKKQYQRPPHVYAVTDWAYTRLLQEKKNQCILVSGESGSGKTETCKLVVQFLNAVSSEKKIRLGQIARPADAAAGANGSSSSSSSTAAPPPEPKLKEKESVVKVRSSVVDDPDVVRIRNCLNASNPILESFGNSRTVNNYNSSRFGKYVQIIFDRQEFKPIGCEIKSYLLEKSRIVNPGKLERCFHIFYQLTTGASEAQRKEFNIRKPEVYSYLKRTGVLQIPQVNDGLDLQETSEAMEMVGLSRHDQDDIWRVLSAILWMGNIEFVEQKNEQVEVVAGSKDDKIVQVVAHLLGVTVESLKKAMMTRMIQTGTGDKAELITKVNSLKAAKLQRDTLAKALYEKVFTFLVQAINKAMQVQQDKQEEMKQPEAPAPTAEGTGSSSTAPVPAAAVAPALSPVLKFGVLDVFGFEIFPFNSFEQLCINYVNEKLQQLFIELTIQAEQTEYEAEGLPWKKIPYTDNSVILKMFESNRGGLFRICDDSCATNVKDSAFLSDLKTQFSGAPQLTVHAASFKVQHYAGPVSYDAEGFLEKNKDTLFDELIVCIQSSRRAYAGLHGWHELVVSTGQKKRPPTLGFRFQQQVQDLMHELRSSQQSYIRCIKSNSEKKANLFDLVQVKRQVQYLGLLENIKVRRAGYGFKSEFDVFVHRFGLLSQSLFSRRREFQCAADGTPAPLELCKAACLELLSEIGWVENQEYVLGKTKIFIQDAKTLSSLEYAMSAREESAARLIQRCYRRFRNSVFFRVVRFRAFQMLNQTKKKRRPSSVERKYQGDYIRAAEKPYIQKVIRGHNIGDKRKSSKKLLKEAGSSASLSKIDATSTAADATPPDSERILFADRCSLIHPPPVVSFMRKLVSKQVKQASELSEGLEIVLTNAAVYLLSRDCVKRNVEVDGVISQKSEWISVLRYRIPLTQIQKLSTSLLSDNFVVLQVDHAQHYELEQDPLLQIANKSEFIQLLREAVNNLELTNFQWDFSNRSEIKFIDPNEAVSASKGKQWKTCKVRWHKKSKDWTPESEKKQAATATTESAPKASSTSSPASAVDPPFELTSINGKIHINVNGGGITESDFPALPRPTVDQEIFTQFKVLRDYFPSSPMELPLRHGEILIQITNEQGPTATADTEDNDEDKSTSNQKQQQQATSAASSMEKPKKNQKQDPNEMLYCRSLKSGAKGLVLRLYISEIKQSLRSSSILSWGPERWSTNQSKKDGEASGSKGGKLGIFIPPTPRTNNSFRYLSHEDRTNLLSPTHAVEDTRCSMKGCALRRAKGRDMCSHHYIACGKKK